MSGVCVCVYVRACERARVAGTGVKSMFYVLRTDRPGYMPRSL